jgi:hypothetical protein
MAADDAGKKPALDVVIPVPEDALHEEADARTRWCTRGGEFGVHDDFIDAGMSLPSDLGWPGHPEEAGVVEGPMPRGLPGPVFI